MMHGRKLKSLAIVAVATTALLVWAMRPAAAPRESGAMQRDIYVWQRAWGDDVKQAVRERGKAFGNVVVLAGQVSWEPAWGAGTGKDMHPRIVRVGVDWPAVKACGAGVGVAIRIGEFGGDSSPGAVDHAAAGECLAELAGSILGEAKSAGVEVGELQIDFDAAESKLEAYRRWVAAIKRRAGKTPVVITALPSWLGAPGFEDLAREAGGYVLQVHSFERPSLNERMTLCDPAAARAAVEKAGRISMPFRVALPTYGYFVAFDAGGKYLGLSAEGRAAQWPGGSVVREVRAQAEEMAELVRGWMEDRPAAMRGVIWYRMPMAADGLNWRWLTLAAVMDGRRPVGGVRAEARVAEDGVVNVELVNAGEADEVLDRAVIASAAGGVESADGVGQFGVVWGGTEARFAPVGKVMLEAGERVVVGWIRPQRGEEVRVDVEK